MNFDRLQAISLLKELDKCGSGYYSTILREVNELIRGNNFEEADKILHYKIYEEVCQIRRDSDYMFPYELDDETKEWYEKAIKLIWDGWREAKDIIFEYEFMCFVREDAYMSFDDMKAMDIFPYPELHWLAWHIQ